jgi:large subunit ribosomal protein L10e
MGLRKSLCYTTPERSYTRKSKVRSKGYVKGVPVTKISKFIMGNLAGYNAGKYPCTISVFVLDPIQIRDNCIEASRMLINRELDQELKGDYYFAVTSYPHQILREKKILMGAGADRMSQGMQLAFGKPCALAIKFRSNGKLFMICCNKNGVPAVRRILDKIKAKIPGRKKIVVEERKI